MHRKGIFLFLVLFLASCVSGNEGDVLQSAASTDQKQIVKSFKQAQINNSEALSIQPLPLEPGLPAAPPPPPKKTYLINGLASSVEFIGYGFTNLSKKIPGSRLHNYASFIESSTVIRSKVTRELKAAYKSDPSVQINLIGISFGANIVTLIAADLDRAGIPVNYLVTMEGPAMVPIRDNVRMADNFSCTNLDCFRTKSRLSWGNKKTNFQTFKIKTSHIPLADHPDVHRRILSRINTNPVSNFIIQ
ncbi:MAG: hypothetical protein AAF478_11615 [Pseudomonadota bacterium]